MSTLAQENAAIELNELVFEFTPELGPVLDIPSWKVDRGDQIFLQGESGSGKSTLLGLLAGLQVPTSGEVSVLGTKISELGNRQRDRFRAKNIGVVFQQFNLIPYLSVSDNVLLAAQFGESTSSSLLARAHELLQRVNLTNDLFDRRSSELSIGQQQRVAIVRALINSPELLLVDEPTSALDHSNRDAFIGLLLEVLEELGCALLFVSHDPSIGERFKNRLVLNELNRVGGRT